MSLQSRIIASLAALLLLTLLSGVALLSFHARGAVMLEVRTAFQGADRGVRDTLKSDVQHTVTLRQVVASFQGQRHVRAALVNETGRVIVRSELAPVDNPAPQWFARMVMPPTYNARIPISLPGYPCVVVLTSDPRSEIADVWGHARDTFLITLLFCVATMAVVSVAINAATRFFRKMEAGLSAVSGGHYNTRLEAEGPPEFARLASGFNHMAAQLDTFSRANRQLYAQLQSVQEEERVSIARDLHDEVGPYLFALQVDAKAVEGLGGDRAQYLGASIRDIVAHIQKHVRAIVRQLRPGSQLEFGLQSAIDDIVIFWKRRHPGIAFTLDVRPPAQLPGNYEEAVFRILQESVSNAVRHGRPSRIDISMEAIAERLVVTVRDDGEGASTISDSATTLGRAGLAGMRERVLALNGQFDVDQKAAGGTRIQATLPLDLAREPA